MKITLSDYSIGMVSETISRLNVPSCYFAVCDAQNPPFSDGIFDVIVANHMLYHMASPSGTIAQLRRLLKPGGSLYASTNGANHMQEIDNLVPSGISRGPLRTMTSRFSLEIGAITLEKHFSEVHLARYQDSLEVTEAEPLAAYCLSLQAVSQSGHPMSEDARSGYIEQIDTEMQNSGGSIHNTKSTGLFKATAQAPIQF